MPEILVLQGLPASGKTTYALELVKERKNGWKRINKDDLRSMIDCSQHSKDAERQILEARDALIRIFCASKKNIVVDDTNLHPKHLESIKNIAKEFPGYIVKTKMFDISVDEAIERDSKRENPVGSEAIKRMAREHLNFRNDLSFYYSQNKDLPTCYVWDIDGTIAEINKNKPRSPFDMTRVSEDTVNEPVVELFIQLFSSVAASRFIFVSGRNECARKDTIEWIQDNILYPAYEKMKDRNFLIHAHRGSHIWNQQPVDLFMRADDDNRKDYVIKEEIYRKHIIGKYFIKGVFDDRKQVCQHIRTLGIPVFQVAEGDF